MTYRNRHASGQRLDALTLARLAALDLTQDDIVRPELRNDAILAGRSRHAAAHRPPAACATRPAGR